MMMMMMITMMVGDAVSANLQWYSFPCKKKKKATFPATPASVAKMRDCYCFSFSPPQNLWASRRAVPHCGNQSNVRFGERCGRARRLRREALQGCSRWASTLVKWVIAGGRYCSNPVLLLKDAVITSNPRCGSRRTFTGSEHTHTHTKFSFIYTLERRSRWGGEKTLNCPHLCVFLGDSSLMNYELVSPPRLT